MAASALARVASTSARASGSGASTTSGSTSASTSPPRGSGGSGSLLQLGMKDAELAVLVNKVVQLIVAARQPPVDADWQHLEGSVPNDEVSRDSGRSRPGTAPSPSPSPSPGMALCPALRRGFVCMRRVQYRLRTLDTQVARDRADNWRSLHIKKPLVVEVMLDLGRLTRHQSVELAYKVPSGTLESVLLDADALRAAGPIVLEEWTVEYRYGQKRTPRRW